MNSILVGQSPRVLKDVCPFHLAHFIFKDYRKSQLLVCKKGACLEKADTQLMKPKLITKCDGLGESCVPAWDALDKHVRSSLPIKSANRSGVVVQGLLRGVCT